MKRIFLSIFVLAAGASLAGAQTMYDALTFGKDNYYGSARTMGMGNAVTAVGGDLGAIGLNPAASAVAGYSQISISQGFTIGATTSSWAEAYNAASETQQFDGAFKASRTRYTMPNIGISTRFDTGNRSGVKSWTFAFVSNMTNNYCEHAFSRGYNDSGSNPNYTSMAGALAHGATFNSDGAGGILAYDLFNFSDPYNTRNGDGNFDRWQYIVAYRGGMINFNRDEGIGDSFYGANEYNDLVYVLDENGNKIPAAGGFLQTYEQGVIGRLNQVSRRLTYGSKNDIAMNFGLNINDNFFLGLNLNLPLINYRYAEYYQESPDNTWPSAPDGLVTPGTIAGIDNASVTYAPQRFKSASYEYNYDADIAGINMGLGFIWLPTRNLRIGGAIKTPTLYTVTEKLYMTVDTDYEILSRRGTTPVSEYKYDYVAPWNWSLGVAYTFGTLGMLSVDYQMTDYSNMKFETFSDDEFSAIDPYEVTNNLTHKFCGISNTWRIGAEIRPVPFLSIRAGYNITTNPESYYYDNEGYFVDANFYEAWYNDYETGKYTLGKRHYVNAPVYSLSLGLGFVSTGSFFADLAVRRTTSTSFFSPYVSYLSTPRIEGGNVVYKTDSGGNIIKDDLGIPQAVTDDIISPSVRTVRNLVDVIFTIGWRF